MANATTLLKKFNNIKTLPHLAIRLTKMISDDDSSIGEFEEVIKMDPTLVLRMMRLVNSPFYGLREKAKSISDALVFLGMKNLRNMIVVEALKDIFRSGGGEDEHFSRSRLWLHCAAVSICSQLIAERIFGIKGEDAFLCGILHDIGLIVEDQVDPEGFLSVCKEAKPDYSQLIKLEKKIIGADHADIGHLLSVEWKFPLGVQEGIRDHHKDLKKVDPKSLTGIMQIAEYMVARIDMTVFPGMQGNLSQPLILHIRDNIDEYKALGKDLPDEMFKARELYELESE